MDSKQRRIQAPIATWSVIPGSSGQSTGDVLKTRPIMALPAIGFFHLPPEIRNVIYRYVLIPPHVFYIFQDGNSRVEAFAPGVSTRWLDLLYTNRKVYREVSALVYGSYRFNLVDTTQQQYRILRSFFTCIGPVNAGFLSHLCISFPVPNPSEGKPYQAELRESDLKSLRLLKDECTSLTTLETYIHNKNSAGLMNANGYTLFMEDFLSNIDAQLREITSLNTIIVRLYDGTPTPPVMELMQGFGWVVRNGDGD